MQRSLRLCAGCGAVLEGTDLDWLKKLREKLPWRCCAQLAGTPEVAGQGWGEGDRDCVLSNGFLRMPRAARVRLGLLGQESCAE